MQDELFVFLGTHQPLELVSMKAAQKNDYLPVHLQSALDDQGRQRLHGAFTGGRSAGYFNTVGSKEGFRPMEFSSSRSSRMNIAAARPEDYMDDEDVKEIKAFSIGATQEYDQFGASMAELESKRILANNIGLEKTALSDIAQHLAGDLVTSSTDSIGSRLLRQMGWREGQGVGPRVKRYASKDKDIHSSKYLFAPSNSSVVVHMIKKDKFGIGYQVGSERPVTGASSSIITSGFGVGIFEEEDDDIYEHNTAEYEATLENDQMNSNNLKKTSDKRNFGNSSENLCKDGRHALQGFLIVGKALLKLVKYLDPVIPEGFTGNHVFEDDNQSIKYQSLNPDQRRDILGDEALKGPDRSVFSYIAAKDQQKLEAYISKVKHQAFSIPKISKEIAKSALRGFMPFGNDQSKQANYKLYLGVMAEESKASLESISESDLKEFAKSAEMYRPMSSFMASRFVSATTPDHAAAPMPQFPETQEHTAKKYEQAFKDEKFGLFSRISSEWHPDRLLCKRFDTPNPYPDFKTQSEEAKKNALLEKQALNERTMESLKQERNRMLAANELLEAEVDDGQESENGDHEDYPMQEKPSMDIFKAIFDDSDSESDLKHKKEDEKRTPAKANSEEESNINQSAIFRPVFRKKEQRKGKNIPHKNSKLSAFRPSSSGVKLVFDFEEDIQVIQPELNRTKTAKTLKERSESEDEWEEAPQQAVYRPRASDLI